MTTDTRETVLIHGNEYYLVSRNANVRDFQVGDAIGYDGGYIITSTRQWKNSAGEEKITLTWESGNREALHNGAGYSGGVGSSDSRYRLNMYVIEEWP